MTQLFNKNHAGRTLLPAGLILVAVLFSSCDKKKNNKPGKVEVRVKTALPMMMEFREKIMLHGTVEPEDHVKICARTEGVIDEMKVDEGDIVKKDQLLFQVDKINLESQVEVEKQNLSLAATRVKEAQGWLDISKAQYKKSEIDFNRSKRLMDAQVEAKDNFEKKDLLFTKSKLQVQLSGAGLKLAEAKVKQAESNLAIAKKKYNDSLIKAPYNAVVTHKYFEKGEYAKMGDCILRLENSDKLEISIFLSSVYYNRIKSGQTKATIFSEKGKKITEQTVTYRAPYIDPETRTFEITIDLPPDKGFVSGMLCEVELTLITKTGIGVPEDAVLPRPDGGSVLFIIKNGKAVEINVRTGIRDNGYIEIVKGIGNNLPVVVSGQSFLNNGTAVKVINDNRKKVSSIR